MLSKLCKIATGKNQREDNIFVKEDEHCVWGCVADGCSTGVHSAFASQLLCYIVANSGYPQLITWDSHLLGIMSTMEMMKIQLGLSPMHLLSTLILFNYNKHTLDLEIRVLGDGVYYVDGERFDIDQNNTPDYIGYQINGQYDNKKQYVDKYKTVTHKDVQDFMICSDGIDSFNLSQFADPLKEEHQLPVNFLLTPSLDSPNILERRFNILTKKGWKIKDDLSVIAYENTGS